MDRDTMNELFMKTGFSKSQLQSLHVKFLRHTNADHPLTRQEFDECMTLLGCEDPVFIDHCFTAFDSTGDGSVDFQELVTSLSVLLHGDEDDMTEFQFKMWDADSTGFLSKQQFAEFWRHSRQMDPKYAGMAETELDKLAEQAFHEADTNSDGQLSYEEFKEALQSRSLLLGNEFYRHLQDPMGANSIARSKVLSGLSHKERQLLTVIAERVSLNAGEDIPFTVQPDENHPSYNCLYLVLEGTVEVSYEGAGVLDTIGAGAEAFVHEEAVHFIGESDHLTLKQAQATTEAKLLRIPAPEFVEAYLQGSDGAGFLMDKVVARMKTALGREESLVAENTKLADFVEWKKLKLTSSDKVLVKGNINQSLVEMRYAVRGLVPITAERIEREIAAGDSTKPFNHVLYCNIGNPHSVGQRPITFYRQVLACVDCPEIAENPEMAKIFKPDVISRAKELSAYIKGGTGSYSHSQGIEFIRKNVASFIQQRDGYSANLKDIFLTNGASTAINMVLSTLIADPKDAVLIPIPQYPIYSALVRLLNGQQIGYYLEEDKGWALDIAEIENKIKIGRAQGLNPKALVIINPGNPVGNCLSYQDIQELVKVCKKERIILLSDEVYQENVYQDRPFVSVKKVVRDLGKEYDGFEFVSFHSTSKGIIGECGRRGGYMELCGFDHEVQAEIYKLASSGLCSNLDGQVMVDLMVRPPKKGDPSYNQFTEERDAIYSSLKRKSELLYDTLNSIPGICSQRSDGAMYAFPSIKLPPKAVAASKAEGHAPDTFYALSLLEHTGICAVPGSGFGQKPGTHHLRLTFLPSEEKLTAALENFKSHHEMFMSKYTAAPKSAEKTSKKRPRDSED